MGPAACSTSDDDEAADPPAPALASDDDEAAPGRTTVVYTPDGAPEQQAALAVPPLRHSTAIVLVHPGGGTGGDRTEMKAWADFYYEHGYLTLSVDYFLFDNDTPSPVFPRPEEDVKTAVQWLRSTADFFKISPNRIIVHGSSAGAYLGGELLTMPDIGPLGVAGEYEGVSDRIDGFIGFHGYYAGTVLGAPQYYGGPRTSSDPEVQARWALADSTENAARATGPALLFHGDRDVVPVQLARRFADTLTVAGKDATLIVVPGAEHGFDLADGNLTPAGMESADAILVWLAQMFSDQVQTQPTPAPS